MKTPKRFWYTIPRADLESLAVEDVLDMLRYDGATVHSNPPDGFYLFSSELGPVIDRWRSFGIGTVDLIDPDTRQPLSPLRWPARSFYSQAGMAAAGAIRKQAWADE